MPGITRRRAGKGFTYHDEAGRRVTDPRVLERIRSLAVPPAWEQVWICPLDNGHLQAVGMDARGRRQYRYHDQWRVRRDAEKFDHMVAFARALPGLRRRCAELLATEDLSRPRVLACAARLLDLGFFRIGGEEYAEENQTYGLATMRKEHVRLDRGNMVTFDYPSKSSKQRIQTIVDAALFDVVVALKRRRSGGPELFAYRLAGGGWADVRSSDINDFIKEMTGGDFTAKDFRTWTATVLAAVALAVSENAGSRTARQRAISRAYREVGHYLGNTAAVCRKSYVDRRVVDAYLAGATIADTVNGLAGAGPVEGLSVQGAVEDAVLDLLEGASPAGAADAA